MAKTRVFISFDYDNDARQKDLLVGQAKHPDTDFEFADWSSKEHLTGDWKAKIKAKLVPTAIGRFGFAAAAGVSYDTTSDELTTVYAYIPATLRLSEIVRINVSGGWQLDNTTDRHFATYGLGFDWKLTDTITFTAETFGIIGNGETGSETQPRYQAGLRYRPIDQFSIDLIYGHNINGENSDWVTLGTTVRFPVQ